MPCTRNVAALAFALAAPPATARTVAVQRHQGEHPVEGVITLLKGLDKKAEDEGKTEALAYQKFEYWCKNTKKKLSKAINKEKEEIQTLGELIDSHTNNIEVLTKDIEDIDDELLELEKADNRTRAQRNEANSLYETVSEDLSGTITAVGEALSALETAKGETDPDPSLIQRRLTAVAALASARVTESQRSILLQFAEEPEKAFKAEGDRAAHVKKFKFRSGNVIELLKQLKLSFEDELTEANKAETKSLNEYNLAKSARGDVRDAANTARQEKDEAKGESEGEVETATGDLGNVKNDLEADSGELKSTNEACEVKASEWASRSQTRTLEREAINAAIKILAKATGVRTEAPSNPVPPPSPVSFLQIEKVDSPFAKKAVQLLREEAKVAHSKVLEQLSRVVAENEEGPFDQVINSIEKMIFHLMNEQTEEDNHKNWCDKELAKTKDMRTNQFNKWQDLSNRNNAEQARLQILGNDITAANSMLEDLATHVKEATEVRKIGKEENAVALQDAEDAQAALTNAIEVLESFYKESGMIEKQSWEFVQRGTVPTAVEDKPSTWESSYTGVADPKSPQDGIISVLERVSSGFAQMESETKAQEATDQGAYDQDMSECQIEKARRTKEVEVKENEKRGLVDRKNAIESEMKAVSADLAATNQYWRDLEPACRGSGSYTERKDARKGEIVALKEAKASLQNATAASPRLLQLRR